MGQTAPMHDRRPNVLFVITDQQRFDHVGFMGNRVVRTPNLDGIAARGTVFERAFVANPVCMPNRCTIMTGRMPSVHGVIFNDRSLDWTAGTHVADLHRAGWRTGLIGKSHLQHGLSRNAVFSAPGPPAVGDPYPPGWDTLEDSERFEQDQFEWPDDFYGFEHVELSIDHGARVSGHHLQWALERGGRYGDLVVPYSDEAPALRRSDRWWQIYQPPYGPELHSTEFVADRTISFIEQARHDDRPWLAWASFPDPHHPMTPPGEWFDRHAPREVPVPSSLGDPLEHVELSIAPGARASGHHLRWALERGGRCRRWSPPPTARSSSSTTRWGGSWAWWTRWASATWWATTVSPTSC